MHAAGSLAAQALPFSLCCLLSDVSCTAPGLLPAHCRPASGSQHFSHALRWPVTLPITARLCCPCASPTSRPLRRLHDLSTYNLCTNWIFTSLPVPSSQAWALSHCCALCTIDRLVQSIAGCLQATAVPTAAQVCAVWPVKLPKEASFRRPALVHCTVHGWGYSRHRLHHICRAELPAYLADPGALPPPPPLPRLVRVSLQMAAALRATPSAAFT
jgi:hypothetical protein